MSVPSFPPLLSGQPVEGNGDPFERALALAAIGCDPGKVVYNLGGGNFRAAIIFTPEVALKDAIAILPICGVGLQNALGALAPPEVAVHLEWDGGVRVNGAGCGRFRVAASSNDANAEPDWLIVGLQIPFLPSEDAPGLTPDRTALYAEGCADVDPAMLLESWTRHTLTWLNRWIDDGVEPLHNEWRGLVHNLGEDIEMNGINGVFLGVDERFGMLLRGENETHLVPLTTLIEGAS